MPDRKSPELAKLFYDLHADTATGADVLEIGRAVEGLENHPGWQHVETVLKALREKRMDDLMRGDKPKDQAVYAQEIGVLKGIETAQYAIETIQTVAREVRGRLEKDIKAQEAAR